MKDTFYYNAQEYSVSEIVRSIKQVISDSFSFVKVRGEISGFKKSRNGHLFFRLKDENEIINAICFARMAQNINTEFEDGIEIIVTGEVMMYNSEFRIKVFAVKYAGIGALMKVIEERKKRLMLMGLFENSRKKKIPQSFQIDKICIITSESGAVLHDMLVTINNRFPKEIMFYNVSVQGNDAANQIIFALQDINRIEKRPDIIIIARGGGSVEDLFCFNDENLALEISRSNIPIISAIGHETDYTILDFVSDKRASTPTAAAEIVTTPSIFDLKEAIATLGADIEIRIDTLICKQGEQITYMRLKLQSLMKNILNRIPDISFYRFRIINSVEKLTKDKVKLLRGMVLSVGQGNMFNILTLFSNTKTAIHAASIHIERECNLNFEMLNRFRYILNQSVNTERSINHLNESLRIHASIFVSKLLYGLENYSFSDKVERLVGGYMHHALIRLGTISIYDTTKKSLSLLSQRWKSCRRNLHLVGHKNVLYRGYALIVTEDGSEIIKSAEVAKTHNTLKVQFCDDSVSVAMGS